MNRKKMAAIAILLNICLLFAQAPFVFAAEDSQQEYIETENENNDEHIEQEEDVEEYAEEEQNDAQENEENNESVNHDNTEQNPEETAKNSETNSEEMSSSAETESTVETSAATENIVENNTEIISETETETGTETEAEAEAEAEAETESETETETETDEGIEAYTEESSHPLLVRQPTGNHTYAVDGDYSEWFEMPHTVIEYNTWDEYDDGLSALYSTNGYCYFDIYSPMPAHLNEGGGEFTSAISVLFNDDGSTVFYPRFIYVDNNGNIDWDPQLNGMAVGTYHFYICSSDAWHTSYTLEDLNNMDLIYGDAIITLDPEVDEMEWCLDLNLVAKKFGMSADEFKTIAVQYGRIGQQWTRCAGTPTYAVGGIILCIACSAIYVAVYKKKHKKGAENNDY